MNVSDMIDKQGQSFSDSSWSSRRAGLEIICHVYYQPAAQLLAQSSKPSGVRNNQSTNITSASASNCSGGAGCTNSSDNTDHHRASERHAAGAAAEASIVELLPSINRGGFHFLSIRNGCLDARGDIVLLRNISSGKIARLMLLLPRGEAL